MSKIRSDERIDKIAHNLRKMFDLRRGLKLHTSMSFRATALRRSYPVVFLLGLIAAPAAFGQAQNSPIAFANQGAITTSFVATPNVGGTAGPNSGDNNQWLKVEFHYGTTALVKAPPGLTTAYMDAVEFKVWIEGLDLLAPDAPVKGKGVAVGFTGSVTYVNIPADKDLYGVFYVHPSTLGRYCSERGYEDFDRKFDIHLEAYLGGVLVDAIDKNKENDKNWFQSLRVIPNLVYRQNQCPFILADPDRYPAIKLPATAQ
jgi:hypothetical protein